MVSSALSNILLLAATAWSLPHKPTPRTDAPQPPYGAYNITNYDADCFFDSTYECIYSFHIAFEPDPKYPPPFTSFTEPPFVASCSGSSLKLWTECDGADVFTNLTAPGDAAMATLSIMHCKF